MIVTAFPNGAMIGPVLPSAGALRPLGLDAVRLTAGFWAERQQRNGSATIPHAHSWIEKTGWLDNLRLAASGELGGREQHRGREFSDSEVFKLAEAMVWERARGGEVPLEELSAARSPGRRSRTGTSTPSSAAAPSRPGTPTWTSGHELYCVGHLIQAGVGRAAHRPRPAAGRGGDPGGRPHLRGVRAGREAGRLRPPRGRDGAGRAVPGDRASGATSSRPRAFVERRGHGTLPEHRVRPRLLPGRPCRSAAARCFAGHAVRALYLASGRGRRRGGDRRRRAARRGDPAVGAHRRSPAPT